MDGFYRAFEDKHRGSRDAIKNRQRVYLPFVLPLANLYPGSQTLDLGCGRGEWLELLTEIGLDARGADLDDGMLQECRDRGLRVMTEDALSALKKLPDSSQAVVSGFHFAEHIPFQVLQQVVQEALRVLRPAGLLIL
ncbi:MAG: class I SAM-dependent methyltransferase, partial [Burkholderiales bacterium]|nr:class I SAM-dependent methyltransferase [Burkholderiales bacterium]